jgi:hypothetical protein
MRQTRNAYINFVGKPAGKHYLEDKEGDGKMILRWIIGRWFVRIGSG